MQKPSEKLYPTRQEDEQEMDMEPVIVGPPAYGSPDPKTSEGLLVAVEDHPLDLSPSFGSEVGGGSAPAASGGNYDSMTKDELVDLARDREIEGFSSMNKAELVSALEKSDSESEGQ